MKILLVGNYIHGHQQSMQRFADLMRELLKPNKEFRNAHRGQTCFILGNGLSLLERMILDLWFSTEGFRSWKAIADRYRNSPVNIYNSGVGGLLNCFPRIPLSAAIK